jgi:predicted DNA-binding antitoxin AbrB/MazE fold protein
MPTTVTAVFQDGVLKPSCKLKLRPNEKVKLHILRQDRATVSTDLGPLAGAFPELAALAAKDLAAGKCLWERGLERLGRAHLRRQDFFASPAPIAL